MTKNVKRVWGKILLVWAVILLLNRMKDYLFYEPDILVWDQFYFDFVYLMLWLFVFTLHPLLLSVNKRISRRLAKDELLRLCCFLAALITSSILCPIGSIIFRVFFMTVGIFGSPSEKVAGAGLFLFLTVIPLLLYMNGQIFKYSDDGELSVLHVDESAKEQPGFWAKNKRILLTGFATWLFGVAAQSRMTFNIPLDDSFWWTFCFLLFLSLSILVRFMFYAKMACKFHVVIPLFLILYLFMFIARLAFYPLRLFADPFTLLYDIISYWKIPSAQTVMYEYIPTALLIAALFYLHMTIMKRED